MENNSNPSASAPGDKSSAETLSVSTATVTTRLIAFIIEQLQRHGLVFLLQALAVMWFYQQNNKLSAEIKACNDAQIEMYRDGQARMQAVIEKNTLAWEQFRQTLRLQD